MTFLLSVLAIALLGMKSDVMEEGFLIKGEILP